MPHHIKAFLGHRYNIIPLSEKWSKEYIQLPQGVCMLFLTDSLFDDITESANAPNAQSEDGFQFLTQPIKLVLEEHSQNKGKLAYIETEYHGGTGSQSAVLFEDGKKTISKVTDDFSSEPKPTNLSEKAINSVLSALGVQKSRDEFESINLDDYRSMPDEDYEE